MTEPKKSSLLQQALAHHRSGRLDEAAGLYRQLLAISPTHPDALHLLGLVFAAQMKYREALDLILQAIKAQPDEPLYHSNLAMVLLHLGNPNQALASSEEALKLKSSMWEALDHKGVALHQLGRIQEALVVYDQALKQSPDQPEILNHKGNALRRLGNLEEAERCYRQSLTAQPLLSEARQNLAGLLLFKGQASEAAALLAPIMASRQANVHNLAGQISQLQGATAAARNSYDQALGLEPDQPLWRFRREAVCPVIAPSNRAIKSWRKQFSRAIDLLPTLDLNPISSQLPGSHAEPPYHLAYQGECNKDLKTRYAQHFVAEPPQFRLSSGPHKIGFLVTAGHEGIFLKCSAGIINHWGASGSVLTLIAPAPSLVTIRKAIHNPAVQFHALLFDPATAAADLRDQGFHLIYFWEVGSDATNYFLPFFRPAPVQVTSWGTADTTGVPAIDHYLSSSMWEDPTAATAYSEKLHLLKRVPVCFPRTNFQGKPDRERFGFSTSDHLYLCAQNLFKLHPDCDLLFARLAERDPKARLVLVEGKQEGWTQLLQERLKRQAPAVAVTFLSRLDYRDYCTLVRSADVMLDSLHFSGGNTSYEALDLGTPIITLPGPFIRGRFTLGCYRTMGLDHCIARDQDDYVERAIAVAGDSDYRRDLSNRIQQSAPLLFEDQGAAAEFEAKLAALAGSL